jgi:competence ComEA-like helix-hairpin-helix protein
MTKRETFAVYGILAVFALGLLFHGLNRYRFYQDFIDISPPVREDKGRRSNADGNDGAVHPSNTVLYTDGELTSDTPVDMIDLNSATLIDLMKLPGIGKVTALNIIDYRTVNGPFGSVDELIEVKGIGEKKLEMLKQYVNIR